VIGATWECLRMFNVRAPRVGAVAACLAMLATPALAQTAATPGPAPAQNGDTWGGVRHAPGGDLHSEEQSAGVALPPGQRREQTDEVEQLQKQILQRARQGTSDGVINNAAGTPTPQ
jgi:hypothetical protein